MIDLNKFFQKVFNFTERPIVPSDSPETIPKWDSFQSLVMIQELEQMSGVSFDINDLKDIKNVEAIAKLLDKYKIKYRL